ncbi:MAG: amidohydrolase family protein [Syntrophorhabdaceae bacterium]|nr:amidohydrolase family protein [Syntrophorhabdaceae bacterium]
MQGKIVLEEHFATEEFLEDAKPWFIQEGPKVWEQARDAICDITGKRLELMDQAGIEKAVLSLTSPAIQGILDIDKAIDAAKRVNEYIANKIRDHKDRFECFAALPTQDPAAAAKELRRCMEEYGFKGALINAFCQIGDPNVPVYLDDQRYIDFWGEVAKLDVPIYIHPRPTIDSVRKAEFQGQTWMATAGWGWHVQLGTQILRLIASGIFDRYPSLQIVIGHMGELLPMFMWRTTNRERSHKRECKAERLIREYFERNINITTSGNCSTPALMCAVMEMGTDRIMFSTDYPYETMKQNADWFDNIPFSCNDKLKMGRANAERLLKLNLTK